MKAQPVPEARLVPAQVVRLQERPPVAPRRSALALERGPVPERVQAPVAVIPGS